MLFVVRLEDVLVDAVDADRAAEGGGVGAAVGAGAGAAEGADAAFIRLLAWERSAWTPGSAWSF